MLSVVAFVCAAAVVLGYGPCSGSSAWCVRRWPWRAARGLAGPAVRVALVILVLSFVLPTSIALNAITG